MQRPDIAARGKEKRLRDFKEVSLGLPKKVAVAEAKRCPQCSDPKCVKGCPLGIDIPAVIRLIREGKTGDALKKINEKNQFPGICGRLCPAPCEDNCLLSIEEVPIRIKELERFVFDYGRKGFAVKLNSSSSGSKIAIVGSGLMGLSAANELTKKGYIVTIYESLEKPGGVLRWGIPDIRMPEEVVDAQIGEIKNLGTSVETCSFIGGTISLQELLDEDFAAVLLAVGSYSNEWAKNPSFLIGGVYSSEEFLMQACRYVEDEGVNSLNFGKRMIVVGSDYTALDVARFGIRIGKKVSVVFSSPEDDFNASPSECAQAKEEGVVFEALTEYMDTVANEKNFVQGITCRRLDYADPESKGEWQLVTVEDSEFTAGADIVVLCSSPYQNIALSQIDSRLKTNKKGCFKVNKNGMTSIEGVFVSGVSDEKNKGVLHSILAGKESAKNIDQYLR